MSDRLAALYLRVSTLDQHPETQLHDLRQMAAQRGLEIAGVYEDRITGARASRPGLDRLMSDARQGKFPALVVWSCDRLARSVRHFRETLDELNRLGVEFLSFREQLDTGGPLGRAVVIIVGAIAELERSLIVERVRAGLRRAKLEGRRLGRPPMQVNREALWEDRQRGRSITEPRPTTSAVPASASCSRRSAAATARRVYIKPPCGPLPKPLILQGRKIRS